MAAPSEDVRRQALAELARRELERRQSQGNQSGMLQGAGFRRFFEGEKALAETAATFLTSALAGPASGIAGLAGIASKALPGDQSGNPVRFVEATQDFLTYSPRSEAGQQALSTISIPFAKVEEIADRASEAYTKGDPLAATIYRTAILGAPALLGLRAPQAFAEAPRAPRLPSPRPTPRPEPRVAPSIDDLRAQANQAFSQAENAGVFISKDAYSRFLTDLRDTLAKEGIDEGLHPAAMRAFQRMSQDDGSNLTLKGAEIIRRNINDAASSMNRADQRMAMIMRDKLDDFMENLGKEDLIGDGQAAGAVSALKEGRQLWSRVRKAEEISELMERARTSAPNFSASGLENAIRTQFRQLAMNPKRMRRYTKEEQDAIKQIARGTPGANALRFIGRYAPTGPVSTAIAAGIGASVGGPLGAAVFGSAGALGRLGASRLTQRNVKRLDELVRGGE